MSGPRLLDKKKVSADVAEQTRQQIQRGLLLAKKVDAVRDTLQEEEQHLEIFRKETIARVQREIDTKITERDSLERSNIRLREERILAQAPIDLKEEWGKVREDRTSLTAWNENLMQSQIQVIAKEAENDARAKGLDKQKEAIAASANVAQQTLSEAEVKFTQASDIYDRAERESEKILTNAHEIEMRLRVREEDATTREKYLSEWEEKVQAHEVDLAGREKKLKLNQETFIKAKNYLKNKQS